MESTTKVLLRIIFHLSNQLCVTTVIKLKITWRVFALYSSGKEGSRTRIGPIFGVEGIGSVI